MSCGQADESRICVTQFLYKQFIIIKYKPIMQVCVHLLLLLLNNYSNSFLCFLSSYSIQFTFSLVHRIRTGYSTIASRANMNKYHPIIGVKVRGLSVDELMTIEEVIKKASAVEEMNDMRIS